MMSTAIDRAGVLGVVVSTVLICAGASAHAQTLKERLSDKASDQQRVDDCRVPPERRGPRLRPDCAQRAPAVTEPPKPR